MTLIERLLVQANKEANELADLLNESAEALAQPQQEPAWFPAVENILNEYGLQAIDFVADFKAALAQPQQEPVAEVAEVWLDNTKATVIVIHGRNLKRGDKLYTSPPAQRQPLTDEQLSAIGSKIFPSTWNTRHVELVRAIEAAHGIKELP